MIGFRTAAALLGATVALAGCSGGGFVAPGAGGAQPGSQIAAAPVLGTSVFDAGPLRPGAPTGTFVGQKIQQLRGDLAQLQQSIRTHSDQLQGIRAHTMGDAQAYYGTTAGINARLQVGTTPGNPMLLQQWNAAQAQLNRIDANIAQMNDLGNRLATDAALAGYLQEAIRAAYEIPGAVDEDHRQLGVLGGEVQQTAVLVERIAAEVEADIARQRSYIAGERQNLNGLAEAIKAGELYGGGFRGQFQGRTGGLAAGGHGSGYASGYAPSTHQPESRRPLVIIRFDRPDVEYEQPLYTALSQALERRPSASFDVVAVTPRGAGARGAKRNADRVLRSLAEMGLPADRVRLSAATGGDAGADEVHIYVR